MIYAYTRVSHQDSLAGGSLDVQERDILAFAESCPLLDGQQWAKTRYNSERPGFFVDRAVSAWKRRIWDRPAGRIMSPALRNGDHVIFWSLDRGFRSVRDFAATVPLWISRGVSVHFVRQRFNLSSAAGVLIANVCAAYAQFCSDIKSERVKAAFALKKLGKAKPREERLISVPGPLAGLLTAAPEQPPQQGRIFGYVRVSDITSTNSGLGLEDQKRAVLRLAEYIQSTNPELSFAGVYEDLTVSAKSVNFDERPSGAQLAATLQPGDHVIFAKVDRGWRNLRDMAACVDAWSKRGITCHFADSMIDTSTATGKMFVHLLGLFAEWESNDISERTSAAVRRLRDLGCLWNQSPPNYCRVVRHENKRLLIPDHRRISDIWHIHLMHKHGMSVRAISDQMEAIDAAKEGRPPIPHHGYGTGKRRRLRYWTHNRVWKALNVSWPVVSRWLSGESALWHACREASAEHSSALPAPSSDHP